MAHEIDPAFLALPMRSLADAALQRARDLGVQHADFRLERIRSQDLALRDGTLQGSHDGEDVGFGVRVLHEGTWGFAASVEISTEEAVRVVDRAVELASISRPLNTESVEIADEPAHPDVSWVSAYDVDPFSVPDTEKVELLSAYSRRVLEQAGVEHVQAHLQQILEGKFYADTAGTVSTQQRVRVAPVVEAIAVDQESGRFETMRTLATAAGRGWEYVTGDDGVVSWDAALDELGPLLAEKLAAPPIEAGRYDVVIDPSNLWLTIHESIGHATELDRALGYEANYAGTSFATLDKLGKLRYGTPLMHVTGDRTARHGLATIGYDDEGVQTQQWDIIRDGILVGYQLDRTMARAKSDVLGTSRSNGCAFADSPGHVPLQRMANVSLQPATGGPSTDELITRVDDGLYIVGDKSWSIDMQRYNFQFTGQRVYRIRGGELAGQVRDVAYQATTTDFWGSMEAVGNPQTYALNGAFNCGKGQPGQVAPVSHGCPSAMFRDITILNTAQEGGE
ncbi:TldD/PmbA family protein [Actinobacteria bacterium YIM 96077]|uniref:TldD/PmbA family protein n=1 Tax=Phytoactinopolyspora halophila TaxID=1981511 RepID=A0A329QYX0_9ACTN|nr:TldD/PmbA family protein [Phytoactinopolyspora halophila]AYY13248.1 TldD/PmbA family protein [Actinobacteria bacterium YIM 96077]RAW17515.1 TldD/PmbA family protein [Phytoactinopolyspora halophila]